MPTAAPTYSPEQEARWRAAGFVPPEEAEAAPVYTAEQEARWRAAGFVPPEEQPAPVQLQAQSAPPQAAGGQPPVDWGVERQRITREVTDPVERDFLLEHVGRAEMDEKAPLPTLDPNRGEVSLREADRQVANINRTFGTSFDPEQFGPYGFEEVATAIIDQLPELYRTDPARARQLEEKLVEWEDATARKWDTETFAEYEQRRIGKRKSEAAMGVPLEERQTQDRALLEKRDPAMFNNQSRWARSVLMRYSDKYPQTIPGSKVGFFNRAGEQFDAWAKANPDKLGPYAEMAEWRKQVKKEQYVPSVETSLDEAMVRSKSYRNLGGDVKDYMPFSPTRAIDAALLMQAVKRVKDGSEAPADWRRMAGTLDSMERSEDDGLKEHVWNILKELPAFAIEFAATGGAYTGVRKATTKAITKAAGKYAKAEATKVAAGVASRAAGVVAQAALQPHRIAENIARKYTTRFGVQQDAKGSVVEWLDPDDPSFLEAVAKGAGSHVIELGSERAGGRLIGIPGVSRIVAMKAGIINRLLKKGWSPKQIQDGLKKAGWHGMIPEVFEERVGEVARGVTGVEEGFGVTGGILANDPESWEQLLAEGIALSVPGAAQIAAGVATIPGRVAAEKPQRQDEAVRQEVGPEIEQRFQENVKRRDMERINGLQAKLDAGGTVSREDANALRRAGVADLTGMKQPERTQAVKDLFTKPSRKPPAEPVTEEPSADQVGEWIGKPPPVAEPPPVAPPAQEPETASYETQRDQAVAQAQRHGHKVTPREPQTPEEQEVADFLESRGKQATFVDATDSSFNGLTDTNTGFMLLRGDRKTDDLWQTVGHEVAHESGLDKTIPSDSAELAKAREARLNRSKGKYRKQLEGDSELLDREARADMVGQFLRDKGFRDSLARENPTMWEQIKEFVLKAVGKWAPKNEAHAKVLEELRQAPPVSEAPTPAAEAPAKPPPASDAGPSTTGTKHAKADELRARAGLPERVPRTPETFEEWEEQARRDYPDAAARRRVVALAEQHPEQIGKVQNAAIGQHLVDLENRREAGEDVQDELLRTVKASDVAGSEAGAALVSRQAERYSDFSLAGIIRKHLDTVGKDPSPEQMAKYEELADKLKTVEGERDELQQKVDQEEIERVIAEISTKRRETIESRFERQYATAADYGIDPKALREAAVDRAEAEAVTARAYNAAYRAVVKATELTPKVIRALEVGDKGHGDLVEYQGLDTKAPMLAREYPELGLQPESAEVEQTKDYAQALVEVIKRGPQAVPQWHDKLAEVAREMSRESGRPVADDAQFPWEREFGKDAFAPDAPRPRKGTKRERSQRKASEAVATFKDAWAGVLKAGASAATRPTSGGIDTEAVAALARATKAAAGVVRAYAELGVNSFLEFTARIKQDIGDITDEQLKVFKDAWREGKVESPLGENPEASEIGTRARQLMKQAVEVGIEGREEVIDAVHEELLQDIPDLTRSETMEAMSGYGDFRELSKDEVNVKVRGYRGEIQQLLKLEDMQAGQAPKKTGVERREPTDEERRLIKRVNEAKKRGGYNVTDPARQLKSALSAAKTTIRNRISDLEQEIATREKIVKEHTSLAPDAELMALREKRDSLLGEHKKIFPPKKSPMSEARQLQMAEGLIKRQIAELEADEKAGRLEPVPKPEKAPLASETLTKGKERKAELIAARKEARKADPEYQAQQEAKRTARYKKAQEKRLAFWEKRLAEAEAGKLPKKRVKKTPETKAILEKKAQIEEIKEQATREIVRVKREQRPNIQKVIELAPEAINASRAIITSFDLSAALRQGGVLTAAHPLLSKEAIVPMLEAFASEHGQAKATAMIHDLPSIKSGLGKRAGLEITSSEDSLMAMEEAYMSRLAEKIPGVAGSARAYMTFLNVQRGLVFESLVNKLGRGGKVTDAEAKVIANWVNVASGRGNLAQAQGAAAALATVFFAPRYVLSRFQLLIGQPLWTGVWKGEGGWRARRLIAAEYGRASGGLAAFYTTVGLMAALLYGDDDEDKPTISFDPRSADFGKIRFGDTRIDPLSGLSQVIRLLGQLGSGQRVNSRGEVKYLAGDKRKYAEKGWWDTASWFARTKLAPALGTAIDIRTGENVVGDKVTPATGLMSLATPLVFDEMVDAMEAQGIPKGTAFSILAILGMGVQTYGDWTEYKQGSEGGVFGATKRLLVGVDEARQTELFEKDLERMQWDSPAPAYSEFLTPKQLNQFEARRKEEKRAVVHNATLPKPARAKKKSALDYEQALKTWEKNQEQFKQMSEGVSHEEALDLFKWHLAYLAGERDWHAKVQEAIKNGTTPPPFTGEARLFKSGPLKGEPSGHLFKNRNTPTPTFERGEAFLEEFYRGK